MSIRGEVQGPFVVCGAGGPLGGRVTEALARRGARVRGLVRSEDGAQRARERGAVEAAIADIRDTAALEQALDGAAGSFYFCPRGEPDEAALGREFVRLCERAGVPRLVVLSMVQAEASEIPQHRASLEVEERLGRSPIEHVIVRSTMFMQILPTLEQLSELGWVGRPYPTDARLAVVDQHDLAEVVAIGLTEDHLVNGLFEVSSAGTVSMDEIAAAASEALGKPIEARQITMEEWAALRNFTFSSPYRRECYEAMFQHFTDYGFKGGNSFTAKAILGREPSSFRDYFARGGKAPWAQATPA